MFLTRFLVIGSLALTANAAAQPVVATPPKVNVDKNAVRPTLKISGSTFIVDTVGKSSQGNSFAQIVADSNAYATFATFIGPKPKSFALGDSSNSTFSKLVTPPGMLAKGDTFHIVRVPPDSNTNNAQGSGHVVQATDLAPSAPYMAYLPARFAFDDRVLVTPSSLDPIGVFFDTKANRWALYNEKGAPISPGSHFNLLRVPKTDPNGFTATTFQGKRIRIPADKAGPNDFVLVTHRVNDARYIHTRSISVVRNTEGEWEVVTEGEWAVGTYIHVYVVRGGNPVVEKPLGIVNTAAAITTDKGVNRAVYSRNGRTLPFMTQSGGKPKFYALSTTDTPNPFITGPALAQGDKFNFVFVPESMATSHFIKAAEASAPYLSAIPGATKADDLIFLTSDATSPTAYQPLGTIWDPAKNQWFIYNELMKPLVGSTVHLWRVPAGDPNAFVLTVTSKGPDGPGRIPLAKADRNDIVLVSHRAATGQLHARPIAVGQEPDTGQWVITSMGTLTEGTQFNVYVIKQ